MFFVDLGGGMIDSVHVFHHIACRMGIILLFRLVVVSGRYLVVATDGWLVLLFSFVDCVEY
jgi:hypothetical protein